MKLMTVLIVSLACGQALAQPGVEVESAQIQEGHYINSNRGYFLDGVDIEFWADEIYMSSDMSYNGLLFPFDLQLEQSETNEFEYEGSGKLNIEYTNGSICSYPMHVKLYSYEGRFYIKSRMQNTICLEGCRRCEPLNLSSWIRHEDPYIKQL